jgi:hypothetical protein
MCRLLCSNITDVECDCLGVKTGTQEDKSYFCLNAVRSCRLQAPDEPGLPPQKDNAGPPSARVPMIFQLSTGRTLISCICLQNHGK